MDIYHGEFISNQQSIGSDSRAVTDFLPQTVEYLTLQLILGYNSGDEEVRFYLDSYDFYIFPVVNPDGE